jgi:hypothetical protein
MGPNHHTTKTTLTLALALSAIAPAAASARQELKPAPATTTTPSQPPVQIVRVSAPGGFDWSDAGIGAAGALGLSTLTIGSGLLIAARRHQTPGTANPGHRPTPAGDTSRGSDSKSNLDPERKEAVT